MSEEKGLSSQEKWAEFVTKALELAQERGLLALNIGGAFLLTAKGEDGSEKQSVQVHGNVFLPTTNNATALYGLRDQFYGVAEDAFNKSIEHSLKQAEADEAQKTAEEG